MKRQRRLASRPDRSALSLFTGAGGLDLGLEAAGFSISICVEVDEDARRTLMANRSSWKLAEPRDIRRIEPDELLAQADLRQGHVALLAGGPPCQPFSKSAYWSNGGVRGLSDPRASGLRAYLKVVEAALPRVLLLENVKGLASNCIDLAPPRAPKYARKQAKTTYRLMPTILRIGPYRFFFYAGDRQGPPHIHVEREHHKAKFWLDPVRLQQSGGSEEMRSSAYKAS